jgi:hypothetical protein
MASPHTLNPCISYVGKGVHVLTKQALYCWSHASSTFCSCYVEDRSLELFAGLASDHSTPDLSLPSN